MSGNTNAFVTWATAVGANVLAASAYAAATVRQQGAQVGIGDPVTFNNAMRQASVVATMIAQFTADNGPSNVQDDGNVATLEAQFISALENIIAESTSALTEAQDSLLHYGGDDSGVANAYVFASPSPAISVYSAGLVILARFATACTGASTINIGGATGLLGVKTIMRPDGSATQNGDIKSNEIGFLVFDGTEFQLLAILPSSTSVPTATTTANGVTRIATLAECMAGGTSGSAPAAVTPEGLASYAQAKWTSVVRSASATETAYNEFIEITASTNCTIGLMTPLGVAGKYVVWNNSAVAQNVSTPAGNFIGGSDYGSAQTYIVVPAGAFALIDSDLTNYVARSAGVASVSNRGVVRMATNVEAENGVTEGSAPAAMSPEDVALYVSSHVSSPDLSGLLPRDGSRSMTGPLITARDPQSAMEAANKEYVDAAVNRSGGVLPIGALVTAIGVGGGVDTVGATYGSSGGKVNAGHASFNSSPTYVPNGQTWTVVASNVVLTGGVITMSGGYGPTTPVYTTITTLMRTA